MLRGACPGSVAACDRNACSAMVSIRGVSFAMSTKASITAFGAVSSGLRRSRPAVVRAGRRAQNAGTSAVSGSLDKLCCSNRMPETPSMSEWCILL